MGSRVVSILYNQASVFYGMGEKPYVGSEVSTFEMRISKRAMDKEAKTIHGTYG